MTSKHKKPTPRPPSKTQGTASGMTDSALRRSSASLFSPFFFCGEDYEAVVYTHHSRICNRRRQRSVSRVPGREWGRERDERGWPFLPRLQQHGVRLSISARFVVMHASQARCTDAPARRKRGLTSPWPGHSVRDARCIQLSAQSAGSEKAIRQLVRSPTTAL